MATDLFGQYYNNPTKSYIYSNLLCNGDSANEMSFDIRDGNGEISTNSEVLSSIGLENVHVPCTQYSREMKTIEPYGIVYIRGAAYGESYTRKVYGSISEKIRNVPDWQYYTTLKFHIKYTTTGKKNYKCVIASSSIEDNVSFVESCQSLLDTAGIPINITLENEYLHLTATTAGFDFWISRIELITVIDKEIYEDIVIDEHYDNPISFSEYNLAIQKTFEGQTYIKKCTNTLRKNLVLDSGEDWYEAEIPDVPICVQTKYFFNAFLQEDLSQYIPPIKYRNGAMKGVVLVAKYPQYNVENIKDCQLSLKVGHLVDRVEDFYTRKETKNFLPYYVRVLYDVVDSYYSQYEFENYSKWAYDPLNPHFEFLDEWIDYTEPSPRKVKPFRPPRPCPVPDENWEDANVPCCNPPLREEPKNPNTTIIPNDKNNIFYSSNWDESKMPSDLLALNRMYRSVSKYEVLGLYGYATYLTKHNLWKNIGQIYMLTATEDDPSGKTRNLIDSFIVYNPNPFPVVINYLTFA